MWAAQRDLLDEPGVLTTRALVYAGEVSFAFYLVHELVLLNVSAATGLSGWTADLVLVPAACLAAVLLHTGVERPCERRLRALVGPATPGHRPVAGMSRERAAASGGTAPLERVTRARSLDRLTSLRSFAALAVVAYHAVAAFWPDHPLLVLLTSSGFTGVTFFYVLSGFVLTWSWRGQRNRDFYRNRAARVWPLHALTLCCRAARGADGARAAMGNALLLHAWVPDRSWYYGLNGVSWSLSCEAFFYACFPVLVVLLSRTRSWRWLLVPPAMSVRRAARQHGAAGRHGHVGALRQPALPPARLRHGHPAGAARATWRAPRPPVWTWPWGSWSPPPSCWSPRAGAHPRALRQSSSACTTSPSCRACACCSSLPLSATSPGSRGG